MSKEIQFLKQIFTFSNAPDDFSLSADERATRDFEKDCNFFSTSVSSIWLKNTIWIHHLQN